MSLPSNKIHIGLILLLSLLGCKNNNDISIPNDLLDEGCIPNEISTTLSFFDITTIHKYTYNDGRLDFIETFLPPSVAVVSKKQYQYEDGLTKRISFESSLVNPNDNYEDYEYDQEGKIIRKLIYKDQAGLVNSFEYIYDGDKVDRINDVINNSYFQYAYFGDTDVIRTVTKFNSEGLIEKEELFEFDMMNNRFLNLKIPHYGEEIDVNYNAVNNITKHTTIVNTPLLNDTTIFLYTYEYDEQGYPVKTVLKEDQAPQVGFENIFSTTTINYLECQ